MKKYTYRTFGSKEEEDVNVYGGNNLFADEIKGKDRRRSIVQQLVSGRKWEGKAIYHAVAP